MGKDWIGTARSAQTCCGVSTVKGYERESHDYYATDPKAAEWLIKLENLSPNIWECACGEGHLAKVFESHGYNVRATDLIDRGYGQGNVDFLIQTEQFDGDIITNPPYKYAEEFVKRAISLVSEGRKVCMFLKVQFLEGQARRTLFNNTPPKTVYVSSKRLHCGKNGVFQQSDLMCFCWFVWEKGWHGTTELKWFN